MVAGGASGGGDNVGQGLDGEFSNGAADAAHHVVVRSVGHAVPRFTGRGADVDQPMSCQCPHGAVEVAMSTLV